MAFNYTVKEKTDLKTFLISQGYSNRIINKFLFERKGVYVNGILYDGNYNLKKGDNVMVDVESESTTVSPVLKPIDVIFEDEYILVVNKPKNLATIPTRAHYDDNLSGRVLNYFITTKQNCGIHVVNRLDLLTSGLVIFAKSQYIHSILSRTDITKKYRCTVKGILESKSGIIDAKISRIDKNSIKRQVREQGKTAITQYTVIKEQGGNSLLDIILLTGRTHQIRVHFSHIGHPLIGDNLYGDGKGEFDLCAYSLTFAFFVNRKQYDFKI